MTKTNKEREANYDLLRIVCIIAVIAIHVSSLLVNRGDIPQKYVLTTIAYDILSRFAVPCFMMLSGAFLLANEQNRNYKAFYTKSFKGIVIPTLIFSVFYFFVYLGESVVGIVRHGNAVSSLLIPIKKVVVGAPCYHMWYLYTLMGLYFFVPILIRLKEDIGEKYFARVSWIFMVVATFSGYTSTYELNWSVSKVICYVGYLLVGYQLRRIIISKKNNGKGLLLLLSSVVVLMFGTYIKYQNYLRKLAGLDRLYRVGGNFDPIIVIASLLMFAGFSYLSINTNKFRKLGKDTFLIYLIHAAVLAFITTVFFKMISGPINLAIFMPACIVVVFLLSWVCTLIYNKIWEKLNKDDRISNALCRLIKLQ